MTTSGFPKHGRSNSLRKTSSTFVVLNLTITLMECVTDYDRKKRERHVIVINLYDVTCFLLWISLTTKPILSTFTIHSLTVSHITYVHPLQCQLLRDDFSFFNVSSLIRGDFSLLLS